ncbi:unnamed protein product [Vitrella brassicaformis CCMP3155]|uniref:Uncharacterized protein n=1 Tax=Vitrella brassicaformis (strain CCMP3155) TaxID=1169540 RepID=A0A0G4H128_VITBC|nr:unnamed protein product [Vitrella brassicaformis CCMP3155]|eukprot:CEM37260.1 unnamed protein product [Vitrella brassicaformis CCMP3155]
MGDKKPKDGKSGGSSETTAAPIVLPAVGSWEPSGPLSGSGTQTPNDSGRGVASSAIGGARTLVEREGHAAGISLASAGLSAFVRVTDACSWR